VLRRMFFRWILKTYEDKEGALWKLSGAMLYTVYRVMIDFESWRWKSYLENIDIEKGQLELFRMMLEHK
jgi:hypothetical protein